MRCAARTYGLVGIGVLSFAIRGNAQMDPDFPDSVARTLSPFAVDVSGRLLTTDRSFWDYSALGRMAEKVGADRHHFLWNTKETRQFPYYRMNPGWEKNYLFNLMLDSLPAGGTAFPTHDARTDSSGPAPWIYQITLQCGGITSSGWADEPAQAFLRSAYLQEVLPGYRDSQRDQFLHLDPKSERTFWTRDLLSMGYAAQYLAKDNPFSPELGRTVFWGYAFDALLYLGLVLAVRDAPMEGSLIILGGMALGKFLWMGSKKSHLNHYNNLVTSGYGIPRHVPYDSLRARTARRGEIEFRSPVPVQGTTVLPRPAATATPDAGMNPANPFPAARMETKISPLAKAGIIGLSPTLGFLGGMAYGAFKGADGAEALGYGLSGVLLGLVLGIYIVIEL